MSEIVDRFCKFVDVRSDDECWEWTGGIKSTGRGNFWLNGKTIQAHRMAWILSYGEIPENLLVLHHCDNGKCVNPKHLFLGTYKDNIHDMISKGRRARILGEDHPASKLKEKDVIAIREMYRNSGLSQYKIARLFGVSRSTIESIVLFSNWRHVT